MPVGGALRGGADYPQAAVLRARERAVVVRRRGNAVLVPWWLWLQLRGGSRWGRHARGLLVEGGRGCRLVLSPPLGPELGEAVHARLRRPRLLQLGRLVAPPAQYRVHQPICTQTDSGMDQREAAVNFLHSLGI